MRPCVGLKPYTPQKDAGWMTEPAVWLPSASGTMCAATAAAEPLEEPPGVCSGLCGLRVLPGLKYAHSVVTVLPMITAPAARRRATTAASVRGVRPLCSTVPFSVGMSAVSMMSFTPTGMPQSAPTGSPLRRRPSPARACASACSSSRNCQACTVGSSWRIRSRQALSSSSALSAPCAMRRSASVAVSCARCSSAIHHARQPQPDLREDVKEHERDDLDAHERHHAGEDLVERHQQPEEQRIDVEVRQQRDKNRHEDDDDLRPLERPAKDEDDELGERHELHRRHVERQHPALDDLLPAEQREGRREDGGADEEPAHHGARLRRQERALLDDAAELDDGRAERLRLLW